MIRIIAALLLATVTAGCATAPTDSTYSGANGKTLIVKKEVWSEFEQYLSKVGGTNPGTFVVEVEGDRAVDSGYSVCPEGHCRADSFLSSMMGQCREAGLTCIVFAQSSTIVANYKREE